eukprot:PITA_30515
MVEEYESIMKNDIWDVVSKPKGKSMVTSKWLFKIKHGVDGSIETYKARFMTRGFSQKEGEDYNDIFASVVRYTTIRLIVALIGFEVADQKTHACKLKKALYGLKQAPKAWYARIDSYLVKLGFTRSNADPNLYFKVVQGMPLILVLYVDDLFLKGGEPLMIECKRKLAFEFEMKDLGLMHYFLSLEMWQRPGEIFLSQGKYVVKLLERFGMTECKSLPTPMELNLWKLCGEVAGLDLANPSEYRQLIGAMVFIVNTLSDICNAMQ